MSRTDRELGLRKGARLAAFSGMLRVGLDETLVWLEMQVWQRKVSIQSPLGTSLSTKPSTGRWGRMKRMDASFTSLQSDTCSIHYSRAYSDHLTLSKGSTMSLFGQLTTPNLSNSSNKTVAPSSPNCKKTIPLRHKTFKATEGLRRKSLRGSARAWSG